MAGAGAVEAKSTSKRNQSSFVPFRPYMDARLGQLATARRHFGEAHGAGQTSAAFDPPVHAAGVAKAAADGLSPTDDSVEDWGDKVAALTEALNAAT
jgi:hypothetical protein